MSKLIATRVNEEIYSKLLRKCADAGCSTYDYLRMLVETDTRDIREKKVDEDGNIKRAIEELWKVSEDLKKRNSQI